MPLWLCTRPEIQQECVARLKTIFGSPKTARKLRRYPTDSPAVHCRQLPCLQ
jgi:hypothetical protein